jgi:hypothetical protein
MLYVCRLIPDTSVLRTYAVMRYATIYHYSVMSCHVMSYVCAVGTIMYTDSTLPVHCVCLLRNTKIDAGPGTEYRVIGKSCSSYENTSLMITIQYSFIVSVNTQHCRDCTRTHAGHVVLEPVRADIVPVDLRCSLTIILTISVKLWTFRTLNTTWWVACVLEHPVQT